MSSYVIDASLVLEWALGKDANKAKRIEKFFEQNQKDIYTHALFLLETSNVLRYRLKDIVLIEQVAAAIQNLPFQMLGYGKEVLAGARTIAMQVDDSVYDASYHALAIAHGHTFVTCDQKYFAKARELGSIELFG